MIQPTECDDLLRLTPDNVLVVGRSRVEAFRLLARPTIPANIASDFVELAAFLKAECDENTCRKSFTPSEAVAMGEAVEAAYRPTAEQAKAAGGGDKKSPHAKSDRGTSPKRSKQDESTRTTSVAAAAVGMDRRTYEKAKEVVASKDRNE